MPLPCYTEFTAALTPVNPKPKFHPSVDVDFDCHGGYCQLRNGPGYLLTPVSDPSAPYLVHPQAPNSELQTEAASTDVESQII